jgi:predicted acylesterase/phospholipase RssA
VDSWLTVGHAEQWTEATEDVVHLAHSVSCLLGTIVAKRSLILAGGGVKVAYQAGALQVWLDEAGLSFDHADGASGGVFNLAMYCQGLSGKQIADNWRSFPVVSSIGLNLRQYLRLYWSESLLTYKKFRQVVLRDLWKLDWERIRAGSRLGTFNVYNFTKNQLEVRTHDQMNEDFLIACVTLPMWFPPVTIGGDRYIDAVYLTDANVIEAVRRGADELWIIWTVSKKAVWKGGFVDSYFQIIETVANGHLKRDLERIEASNAAIARGEHGEFGRPIKIEMLAAEVPLHYLINLVGTDFAAAVEQGVADARAWCRDRGIPLTGNAEPGASELVALKFDETMKGGFALGETDPEQGRLKGEAAGTRLAMHANVRVNDLDRFLNVADHPGSLSGTIDFPPFGMRIPASTGAFNLFRPSDDEHVRHFIYELAFQHDGQTYYLSGRKKVRDGGSFLDATRETTTLYTRLHQGSDTTGQVVGAGVLTLGVDDLIAMMETVRILNTANKTDAAAALSRFGRFFLGQLWNSYGKHLGQPS